MRRLWLRILLGILLIVGGSFAPDTKAAPKTKPIASYTIQALWDEQTKQINASERVTYVNDSRDSLSELWMHLYMNGFSSPNTTWMREAQAGGGREGGSTIDLTRLGTISITALSLVGGPDLLGSKQIEETLMRIPLPQPLQPGGSVQLDLGFTVQMPNTIARTGYEGDYVFGGQWYPKMSVYYVDPQGHGKWNNIPWHSNSEFFADFGTYDVTITLPERLVVGATGLLRDERNNGDGTKTVNYYAEDVNDFAWVAHPDFKSMTRKVTDSTSGINVDVVILYLPEYEPFIERYFRATEQALVNFSHWYGPYQHPRFTVVVPPSGSRSGGMEYPMLVTSDAPGIPDPGARFLEIVTIHETAHQWIPMIIATNEMTEPWLDEGFTQYVTARLMSEIYGPGTSDLNLPYIRMGAVDSNRITYFINPKQTPVYGDAWTVPGYVTRAYMKPALVLGTLEGYLGKDRFLRLLNTYWERWKYRHPRSEDFIAVANEVSGEDLSWFFDAFIYKTAILDYSMNEIGTERQADGSYSSRVVVARNPDVAMPVDLRLTFADGSARTERWDAQQMRAELNYNSSSALVRAELDPERKYPIELNPLDNSLRIQPQAEPAAGLANWWLGFFQGLLRFFSYSG